MAATIQRLEAAVNFAFFEVGGTGRPRPADRKAIRSHCMRGKNRRIGVPRDRRRPSPTADVTDARGGYARAMGTLGDNIKMKLELSPSTETDKLGQVQCSPRRREDPAQAEEEFGQTRLTNFNLNLHRPSSLSSLQFAFGMSNEDKSLILNFLHSFTMAMYPIELFYDSDHATSDWKAWLFEDAVYLHCSFFMASVMQDLALASRSTSIKPIKPETYAYLRQTIIALNNRLSGPESDQALALSDSTIAVVVILAMFNCMIGDHAGAKAHVAGLKIMVQLRGGMQGVVRNQKLFLKLGRIDLVYALNTGLQSPGLVCNHPIPFSPAFHDLDFTGSVSKENKEKELFRLASIAETLNIHPYILHIFHEMQHYSTLVNAAHKTRQRRQIEEFHTAIASFQYRLLQLQGCIQETLSECLRLTLLAFLITTFQYPGTRARYPFLADSLRQACQDLALSLTSLREAGQAIGEIVKWILIVGGVSVFDVGVECNWMRAMWEMQTDGDDMEWETVRTGLKRIMWVDLLQDSMGRSTFEQLNRKR